MSKKTKLWYRASNYCVTLRHYTDNGWDYVVLNRRDVKELGWLNALRKEYDYLMKRGLVASAKKPRYFLELFLFEQ